MIHTKYHGEIKANKDEVLCFEKGIPGFLDEKEFIILPLSDKHTFSILQSIITPNVAFVITSPFHFFPEYDFKLEDIVVEELSLTTEKEVQVYSILTVEDPIEKTTANLQAPIVINHKNKRAKQVILNEVQYKTKHPIFQKG